MIHNNTSCQLEKKYSLSAKETSLSLPDKIAPRSFHEGTIDFSKSILHLYQNATYQYLVSCGNTHHRLSFNFYTCYNIAGKLGYFFEADYDQNAPFLVFPAGKVDLERTPLVIELLNKEVAHENNQTNTDDFNSNLESCESERKSPDNESNLLSNNPSISDNTQSTETESEGQQ